MDDEKLYRHIVSIMSNIYRMNIHYEYAVRHLESIIDELETTDEQEKWKKYKDTLTNIDLDVLDIDWEKELERYK